AVDRLVRVRLNTLARPMRAGGDDYDLRSVAPNGVGRHRAPCHDGDVRQLLQLDPAPVDDAAPIPERRKTAYPAHPAADLGRGLDQMHRLEPAFAERD